MKKIKIRDLPFWNLSLISFVAVLSFALGSLWTKTQYLEKEADGQKVVGTTKGISATGLFAEITPKGTPDYGEKTGVSYDKVEESLSTLVKYDEEITLSGANKERYVKIGTTKETACEFCCGIGEAGFATKEGEIACGCSHNIAFSGLTKWLIRNSSYSNEQIVEEVKKWKILFFPEPAVKKEAEKRGIPPESIGLPSQQGGC